jgi:hypothetical protein
LNTQLKNIAFFLLVISVIFACNTRKYLEDGETYLERNNVEYKEQLFPINRALVKDQIPELLLQERNSGFLWIPRHWFYYRDQKLQKDNWYWNFINNNIAEKPAIIKKSILERTSRSMQEYLYTKGYLNAEIQYKIDTGNAYSEVTYQVYAGKLYTIDSFTITATDTTLLELIRQNRETKYLREGVPIDKSLYKEEVNSIVDIARNNGYPQFYSNYIDLLALDTSSNKNIVQLNILSPPGNEVHKKYDFGSISVHPDKSKNISGDSLLNQVNWKTPFDEYTVNVRYLKDKLRIKPGQIYSKERFDETLRNFNTYDIYRFPTSSVSYDTSTLLANYDIYLHKNKRYRQAYDLEVFYSDISNVDNQLIGLSGSILFSDRNVFGGGEVFTSNAEGSFELGLNNTANSSANSYNFNIGFGLRIPRFSRYPVVYDLIDWITPKSNFVRKFKENAQIRHSLEYQFTRRVSFYTYNSINALSGYIYTPNLKASIELNHLGINYWIPTIEPAFDDIIGENVFFRRRFSQRLITGFLFKDFSLEYNEPPNAFGESYRFVGSFETSGLEVLMVEQFAQLAGANIPFKIGNGSNSITFSKYLRTEVDGTYHRQLGEKQAVAARATAGIGLSLDPEGLPYIKQFYVGGPYSIRAWPLRALGPGSFRPDSSFLSKGLPFYQTGDFKFEVNFEYRFHIAWIIEGGLYLDVGNVWNINDENPDYNLRWDSFKQLAMGTGFGLRLKFPFEVTARIDLGYPLHYPYTIRGAKWIFNQDFSAADESIWEPLTFNFAIGYPF